MSIGEAGIGWAVGWEMLMGVVELTVRWARRYASEPGVSLAGTSPCTLIVM